MNGASPASGRAAAPVGVCGIVQGVGFRQFVRRHAMELGLGLSLGQGWVAGCA